ncbi:porin family protein [Halopseudomonas pelagia]|uniref:porin family protein n=1 Tax=Halopseudomonas pelagia TaxID=553151 RepID=UPI0003A3622E|nr:porin family protein [Halopseudomonas pelagia]|tara:strand:- start:19160 stop:20641 length:1482 start_codon:yes stop_codon:yes gene_type:complete
MPCRFRAVWLLSLACLVAPGVWADDDDTRFLQDQTRRSIEQKAQAEEALAAPPGTLMYEGQRYQVTSTLEALTPAIYVAINTNQWTQLPDFVARYRELPGHRPALANMAESLLARFDGNYPLALQRMEQASGQEPEDARIQLELARLWFEDHQEKRAEEGFARVLNMGLPEQAQMLVQQYRQAMDIRASWHGSAAVGVGYNDNINQANGYYSCLSSFFGICFFERKMPDPVESGLASYELSLQRRYNLAGNHNLQLRPMSYGTYYSKTNPSDTATMQDYSTNLAQLQMGYQYLNARNSISVMPYAEHYYRNRASEYLAQGLQLEWQHTLSRKWQLSTSLDTKRYEYTSKGQRLGADYEMHQWGVTAAYMPGVNTSLYGGVTLTRRKYEVDQASSKEWGMRGGVYHAFAGRAGFFVNGMGIYRETRNDAYDFFLGERRYDKQQVYILSAGANGWKIAGLTPELRVRHSINHSSNLDWAFGFKQTELSLMLRRNF